MRLRTIAAVMFHGLAGVVSFPVTGRVLHDGIVIGDARLLRGLRDAVDVRPDRDDGLAGPPDGDPPGRQPGDVLPNGEPLRAQDSGEIA
jgi:hypothetical protein